MEASSGRVWEIRNSVYKRFARWCDRLIWDRMHRHFVDDPDMEYLIIDSTIVRAHACAAGAPAKKGDSNPRRSVEADQGGFSTKIHVSVDGLGNPTEIHIDSGTET